MRLRKCWVKVLWSQKPWRTADDVRLPLQAQALEHVAAGSHEATLAKRPDDQQLPRTRYVTRTPLKDQAATLGLQPSTLRATLALGIEEMLEASGRGRRCV